MCVCACEAKVYDKMHIIKFPRDIWKGMREWVNRKGITRWVLFGTYIIGTKFKHWKPNFEVKKRVWSTERGTEYPIPSSKYKIWPLLLLRHHRPSHKNQPKCVKTQKIYFTPKGNQISSFDIHRIPLPIYW